MFKKKNINEDRKILFDNSSLNIISLSDICYAYEDEIIALNHFNLDIQNGKTYCLMGPNGCGKTTVLSMINGLLFPNFGTYTFMGQEINEIFLKDIHNSKAFHQKIGYVFQNSEIQLFCGSVEEDVAFGPSQMGLSNEEILALTNDCLKLLGIEHLRKRASYHLSGGEKKKAAIASVLSLNPDVLTFDEPLNTLDEKTKEWLTNFIIDLKSTNKTIIIATHNREFAKKVADVIVEF